MVSPPPGKGAGQRDRIADLDDVAPDAQPFQAVGRSRFGFPDFPLAVLKDALDGYHDVGVAPKDIDYLTLDGAQVLGVIGYVDRVVGRCRRRQGYCQEQNANSHRSITLYLSKTATRSGDQAMPSGVS